MTPDSSPPTAALRRWLARLRDPASRQAFNSLYSGDAACPLGHGARACADLLGLVVTDRGAVDRDDPAIVLLTSQIINRFVAIGFDRFTLLRILRLNDDQRLSLAQTADWLERQCRKQERRRSVSARRETAP
jgi:hypothetical protein